jgi:hypothetical protein
LHRPDDPANAFHRYPTCPVTQAPTFRLHFEPIV